MFLQAGHPVKLVSIVIAALLLAACSTGPHVVDHAGEFRGGSNAVYIANHGWHTGIVVPASAIQARLPQLQERFGAADFLEFGWGDKDFYQAEEMTFGLAVQAVFWPTDTVVRAVRVPPNLSGYFARAGVIKLCVSEAELSSLLTFIASSFAMDAEARIQPSETRSRRSSQFYSGSGQYHMTNTCNTWTAKGLKSMGMELSTAFKLTSGSVMNYLHDHPQVQSIAGIEQSAAPEPGDFSCQ